MALGAAAVVGVILLVSGSASADVPVPPPGPPPGPPPPVPPGTPKTDTVWAQTGGIMNTKEAQQLLKDLGPAAGSNTMTNLVVDGIVGPITTQATKDFQSIKGITVDGIIGPQTATTLYNTWTAAGFGPTLPAV